MLYRNKNIERKINTTYELLIDYIFESIRKIVGGLKDKVGFLRKADLNKAYGEKRIKAN